MRLARALFEAGQGREALEVLEGLPETRSQSETDHTKLLLARVMEELGEAFVGRAGQVGDGNASDQVGRQLFSGHLLEPRTHLGRSGGSDRVRIL